MLSKVWDEIIYPFPKFTCTVEILAAGNASFTGPVFFDVRPNKQSSRQRSDILDMYIYYIYICIYVLFDLGNI